MTLHMTRARVIQLWFSIVALIYVVWTTFGDGMSAGTAALLLALSLVPAGIVLFLWPRVEPLTAGDVIRGS